MKYLEKKFIFIVIILSLILIGCCDKKNQYEYVKNRCTVINYKDGISVLSGVKISKCIIETYDKATDVKTSSISISKDSIGTWSDGTRSIEISKGLSTNENWKIILNDTIV